MNKAVVKKNILQFLSLSGVLAAGFYAAHIIAGRLVWIDYKPLSQPISDLTAQTAASRPAAAFFSLLANVFAVLFCVVMLLFFKRKIIINYLFYLGIIIKTAAEVLSFFAHEVFPLADTDWGVNLQNLLHNGFAGAVILGYLAVSIIMTIGIAKTKKYPRLTKYLIFFSVVYIGSSLFILVAVLKFRYYFGLAERINIYSLQLTNVILSLWMFKNSCKTYHNKKVKRSLRTL